MNPTIVLLSCIVASISCNRVNGQERIFTGFLSPNIDNSVYTAMQNIWYANERISYLCFLPVINNQITPTIPLREGEGKKNVHVMEGSLYFQVPIVMGRNHGNHRWQTSRLTFNAGFNVRMASDSSSPLVPYNDIFGLTFDKVIWNSHTGFGGGMRYAFEDWKNQGRPLHNVSMELTANHYSNGQQPGFFLRDTVNGVPRQRNDYKKGDFSTNYLRLGFTYSYLSTHRNLFSANLAYQWDGEIYGPLSYSTEQEKSYGHHRLTSFFQYIWLIPNGSRSTLVRDVCEQDKIRRNVRRYHELIVRLEPAIILDDLSEYHVPGVKKYRTSLHAYLQYTRPNWRAFGFLYHFYAGRDYSNIRYDMPIIAMMAGFSVNFNKYYPALNNAMRFQ